MIIIYYDCYHYAYVFGMGASKRPCFFEVFGVGWGGGGCNNVHVSCVQGDATWMLR